MKVVVGLVGNVCCGKSTVAKAFVEAGAHHWDADAAVHLIHEDREFQTGVRIVFGEEVFSEGRIDRKKLGQIVFSDAKKLDLLKGITYPFTRKRLEEVIEQFKQLPNQILLVNAPALFESGNEFLCDKLIFVSAPAERRKRWAAGRGWSEGDVERREALLIPEKEKRCRCHAIIDNSGSEEDLKRAVLGWIKSQVV